MPIPEPSQVPRLDGRPSRWAGWCGLGLAASSALPLTPRGQSFLDLLRGEFARGPLEGLLMTLGFGSPYLFGGAVAMAAFWLRPEVGRRWVRVPLALLHAQLVLVAIAIALWGEAVAAYPLVAFAFASGGALAYHGARYQAEGREPSLSWYVRWGGAVVTGVGSWIELQRAAGVQWGIGLETALFSAIGLILLGTSRRPT